MKQPSERLERNMITYHVIGGAADSDEHGQVFLSMSNVEYLFKQEFHLRM